MAQQFINAYPSDLDASIVVDLSLRRLFCDFLGGSLLIVMARIEDEINIQVNPYSPKFDRVAC